MQKSPQSHLIIWNESRLTLTLECYLVINVMSSLNQIYKNALEYAINILRNTLVHIIYRFLKKTTI